MKKILSAMIMGLLLMGVASAAPTSNSAALKVGINKYKQGNYTGCLQDMQALVKRDPSNAFAYYYIAMSYVQANNSSQAIKAYEKVIALNSNPALTAYATKGKTCLQTPEQCNPQEKKDDLDVFISSPYGDGLSDTVKTEIEARHLQKFMNDVGAGKDISPSELQQFRKFDNNKSENTESKPTKEEIAQAVDTLKRAGLQLNTTDMTNPYAQMMSDNPQINEMSMLMGMNNQNNNNNAMMSMLPYMMSQQSANGNGKAAAQYTPQMLQTMMMQSMIPNLDFGSSKKDY